MILAAGASRRLGRPKQLIKHHGISLIRRLVIESRKANVGDITVVTGCEHEKIASEIHDLKVAVFYNSEWEEGQGASIRHGLKHVFSMKPTTNAVLLAVVDQPFVTATHLKKLTDAYLPREKMIVASAYSGTFGVPILFDKFYFESLMQLKGDKGAKNIFMDFRQHIIEIPCPEAAIDIDRKEDLDNLE